MIQYVYLNQICDFTKGKISPRQALHAASNGLTKLYAHTPELIDLATRISPISADDCAIIEREYNACIAHGDEAFSKRGFLMGGIITPEMCIGTEPFYYALCAFPRNLPGDRMQWEDIDEEDTSHSVQFKLYGSDFILLKEDVDTLLNNATPKAVEPKNIETDELGTSERKTLLRLILGMAMQKYGYDPKAERNTATGTNSGSIAHDLQKAGFPMDTQTIRKYLAVATEEFLSPGR